MDGCLIASTLLGLFFLEWLLNSLNFLLVFDDFDSWDVGFVVSINTLDGIFFLRLNSNLITPDFQFFK